MRESKGLENDVKILVQKKMALQDENDRIREELNRYYLEGTDDQKEDQSQQYIMQNKALTDKIEDLKKEIANQKSIIKSSESRHKRELEEARKMVDSVSREAQMKEKNLETKKKEAFQIQQDSARKLSEIEDSKQKQEAMIQDNQRMIEEQKQARKELERQLRMEY